MGETIYLNLHTHSLHSDGALTPEALAGKLAAAGVRYAVLADHDTFGGWPQFRSALDARGIPTLPGIELTARDDGRLVHLLAYGFDPEHPELVAKLASMRHPRASDLHSIEGALRMVGARHAAGSAPGDHLEIDAAIALVHRAGGHAFLAHPLVYEPDLERIEKMLLRLKAKGLDGIEAFNDEFPSEQQAALRDLAHRHDLLVSAGTDYHGVSGTGSSSLGIDMPLDDWQRFQCERLRLELITALTKLSVRLEQAGEYEDALLLAKRWLAIDPADEGALRQLMSLYARLGRRSSALRQYESGTSRLQEELGVEPELETAALYQQISAGRWPEQRESKRDEALSPHNLPAQLTPFVGRETELDEITSLLAKPACRLLTLVGSGGCGKTRLAIRVADLLAKQGVGHYSDGIYFVPLAALDPADSIVPALAYGLNFSFNREGEDPRRQLIMGAEIGRPRIAEVFRFVNWPLLRIRQEGIEPHLCQ